VSGRLLVEKTNKKRKSERKCDLHKAKFGENINAQPFAFVMRIIKMLSLPLQGMLHHVHPIR
jgi:hypothetical protein